MQNDPITKLVKSSMIEAAQRLRLSCCETDNEQKAMTFERSAFALEKLARWIDWSNLHQLLFHIDNRNHDTQTRG